MQIEIVNLVNENKALTKDSDNVMRRADGMTGDYRRAEVRLEEYQRDSYKQAEALINANKEIARL